MPRVDFDQLPDDARLWIFPAERPLSESEQAQLLAVVDPFIDQWGAHAVPLTAGREMRYDRFLFVAVDQRQAGPSGCSIDALLDEIWAAVTEDTLTWYHQWRPGDLVMWDNRTTMHRRNAFDVGTRRVRHRTQIKGATPSAPPASCAC